MAKRATKKSVLEAKPEVATAELQKLVSDDYDEESFFVRQAHFVGDDP